MTNLEALQSMIEYKNNNLLAKALTDRALSSTATYALTYQKSVELAAADIYLILANHPKFREGSKWIEYSTGALMALRRELLRKHGAEGGTIDVPMDSRYNKSW